MSSFPSPSVPLKSSLREVTAVIVMAPAERGDDGIDREETLRSVLTQEALPQLILVVETSLDAGVGTERVRDITDLVLPHDTGDEDAARPTVLRVVASGAQRFGAAAQEALTHVPQALNARWVWLLHDDMVARPDALEHLMELGDSSRTIGIVGPKQVRYRHPEQLLELGIDAMPNGRRVFVIEPDEIDQGQHDQRVEVLAVGTAGMLVRTQVWREVEGLDPALGAFGGGLEFGRRTWRSGSRVVVAPAAVVEHAQASYGHDTDGRTSFGARRAAQLYNWALALPQWQLWLLFLWLPFWSVARSLARLFSRHPALAFGEIGAYLRFIYMLPALRRGRSRLRRVARVPRSALTPLEATSSQISRARRANRKISARGSDPVVAIDQAAVGALHRHRLRSIGAFAALVVVAAIVSASVWFPYRSGVQGGSWGGLPADWTTLMAQAWSGWQVSGDGLPGPASPLLLPLSLVSAPFALVGISPLVFADLLLYVMLPVAAMEGWALASSFTRSTVVRLASGALWATSGVVLLTAMRGELASLVLLYALPPVIIGLVHGLRPPVVLLARGVGSVVAVPPRNTVAWLGVAGLAAAATVCAAPIMIVIAPIAAFLIGQERRAWGRTPHEIEVKPPRRATRIAAILAVGVPGLVMILPTLVQQVRVGTVSDFWIWLAAPSLGSVSVRAGAGIPASVPLSSWTATLAEAAVDGLVHPWLLVAAAVSGAVLILWALACAVRATIHTSPGGALTLGSWLFGMLAMGGALVQALALPGDGMVSAAFFAAAASAMVVCIGSAYPNYSLTAQTLGAVRDRRGRWSRGLPAGLGMASATAAVGLLVLGPIGFLGVTSPPASGASSTSDPLSLDVVEPLPDETAPAARDAVFPPERSATFVGPAPATSVPVIAQQAQTGPRAARLLSVRMDSGTVEAYLLRGPDLQEADLRTAPLASVEALGMAEMARGQLRRTVALLTAQPSSLVAQMLAEHAIDIVMVSSQSEDFVALQGVLDSTVGLERIGNVEGSMLWRVRPQEQVPARVTVYASDTTVSGWVPSGSVQVDADITPETEGTLVLAEAADPGWHASLNGRQLESASAPDGGWRQAFELPAGGGHLQVVYSAPYLWWWWIATGLILVLVALMAIPRRVGFRKFVPIADDEPDRLVPATAVVGEEDLESRAGGSTELSADYGDDGEPGPVASEPSDFRLESGNGD